MDHVSVITRVVAEITGMLHHGTGPTRPTLGALLMSRNPSSAEIKSLVPSMPRGEHRSRRLLETQWRGVRRMLKYHRRYIYPHDPSTEERSMSYAAAAVSEKKTQPTSCCRCLVRWEEKASAKCNLARDRKPELPILKPLNEGRLRGGRKHISTGPSASNNDTIDHTAVVAVVGTGCDQSCRPPTNCPSLIFERSSCPQVD